MDAPGLMDLREVALRLAAATAIGGVLGAQRELRGKAAGLRTHALVTLGAAMVTMFTMQLAFDGTALDRGAVSRAIQGVITGIGFLGGGVILRDETDREVHGLTTAASIWIAASLGIVCGAGDWQAAGIALAFTLAVLVLGGPIEKGLRRLGRAKGG
jgi:putative Mg2+ transporter-C (MgtC) family protein